MNKKILFLLGVVLLITGQLHAAQELRLVTLTADGTEASYAITNVQKIVFENNAMSVDLKSGDNVTGISRVSFKLGTATSTTPQITDDIFVFPVLVKTNLTIAGVAKNVQLNLFNLNGMLLQSFLAQENPTNINVSTLSQGTYLLQVENKTVKFFKQ